MWVNNPEYIALLASVLASPEDDLTRLVLADWLDEHSAAEYAEFIRVQCELARLTDAGWRGEVITRASKSISDYGDKVFALRRREQILYDTIGHKIIEELGLAWDDNTLCSLLLDGQPPVNGEENRNLVESVNFSNRQFTLRRGFVSTVVCDWRTWAGGECGRCGGHRIIPRAEVGGSDDMVHWDDDPCPDCSGTGRTEGIASQLVRLSDPCEKCEGAGYIHWYEGDRGPKLKCPYCTDGRVLRPVQPGMHPIREVRLTDWPQFEPRPGGDTYEDTRFMVAGEVVTLRRDQLGTGEKVLLETRWPGITFHLPETTRPAATR